MRLGAKSPSVVLRGRPCLSPEGWCGRMERERSDATSGGPLRRERQGCKIHLTSAGAGGSTAVPQSLPPGNLGHDKAHVKINETPAPRFANWGLGRSCKVEGGSWGRTTSTTYCLGATRALPLVAHTPRKKHRGETYPRGTSYLAMAAAPVFRTGMLSLTQVPYTHMCETLSGSVDH